MSTEDYAVIVGIDAYPALRPLRGAVNDARAFRDWLVSPLGGGLLDDGQHVHLIISDDYQPSNSAAKAHPWKDDVYSSFNELREIAKNQGGRTGRRLYMFFAGHGISPDNEVEEAALLMANAAKDSLSHVPGRKVANHFRAAAHFDQVVLFMDCCREAWGAARVQRPDWQGENGQREVESFFAFATAFDGKTREALLEVEPGKPAFHGIFTAHALKVLRGGRMSAETFRRALLNSKSLANGDAKYNPKLEPEGQNQIIFNEAMPELRYPVRITVQNPARDQEVEVRNGTFKTVICERIAEDSPILQVSLPPGYFEARLPGTRREYRFDVPGQDHVIL